jgi:hypothetical protein
VQSQPQSPIEVLTSVIERVNSVGKKVDSMDKKVEDGLTMLTESMTLLIGKVVRAQPVSKLERSVRSVLSAPAASTFPAPAVTAFPRTIVAHSLEENPRHVMSAPVARFSPTPGVRSLDAGAQLQQALRESVGPRLHARPGQPDEACPAAARQLCRAPGRDTQTQLGTYSRSQLFKMPLAQCTSSLDMIRGGRTSVRQKASLSGAVPG